MEKVWNDTLDGFQNFVLQDWAQELINPRPFVDWNFMWLYALLLLVLLAGGIGINFRKLPAGYKSRWSNFFWSNFFIGLLLFFCRQQNMPYLGMDLLRVIHELAMIYWVNSIIWYRRTAFHEEAVVKAAMQRKEKYLPKAKKS